VFTDEEGKFVKAKRLVNEANLVFYVDQTIVDGNEPERIYIYDLKNNIPLVDFVNEPSNTVFVNDSRTGHLGRLQREGGEPDGAGIKYKIRITDHINSILLRDSTNVKLGLSVSANINLEFNNPPREVLGEDETATFPISAVLSPRSTVLYGNRAADPSKRVYLEIFYTEPEFNN
ncbi:MAG: DUF4270 family protein, partial [Flavobacteriaceae bacterium]|nr:DUF4270 family protein [Flavobacteriaceae bacterium]